MKKNVLIGNLCRPPSGNVFFPYITSPFNMIQSESNYLFGDCNINMLDINGKVPSDFYYLLASYNLLPLIDKSTRITSMSVKLIDNILTNCLCYEGGMYLLIYLIIFLFLLIKLTSKTTWQSSSYYCKDNYQFLFYT